jgi:hypothetical protein
MLITIKGTYENGKIILEEKPPFDHKVNVLVVNMNAQNEAPEGRNVGNINRNNLHFAPLGLFNMDSFYFLPIFHPSGVLSKYFQK